MSRGCGARMQGIENALVDARPKPVVLRDLLKDPTNRSEYLGWLAAAKSMVRRGYIKIERHLMPSKKNPAVTRNTIVLRWVHLWESDLWTP